MLIFLFVFIFLLSIFIVNANNNTILLQSRYFVPDIGINSSTKAKIESVPAKVDCSDAINPGDRLVTSSENGYLKKYMGDNAGDLLVARALESCESGAGLINVWI